MKQQESLRTYTNSDGSTFQYKSGKPLIPHTSSGRRGKFNISMHLIGEQMSWLQQRNPKTQMLVVDEFEKFIYTGHNIFIDHKAVKEQQPTTATADKTPIPADTTSKWIFDQLKSGLTETAIKLMFTGNGWTNEQIQVYFPPKVAIPQVPPPPTVISQVPQFSL